MTWFGRPRDPQEQRGFELIGAATHAPPAGARLDASGLLEAQSGIDQTVISRLENGKQYGIRWSRFALLVDALGGIGPHRPAGSAEDRPSIDLTGRMTATDSTT